MTSEEDDSQAAPTFTGTGLSIWARKSKLQFCLLSFLDALLLFEPSYTLFYSLALPLLFLRLSGIFCAKT